MIQHFIRRWRVLPGLSVRRFPVALLFSLLAALSAIALHHQGAWGVPTAWEGGLYRVLLLWPFALFGNVCWAMWSECRQRPPLAGLILGVLLLAGAFLLLPEQPLYETAHFWFRYYLLLVALLLFAAGLPARRVGHPDVWDSAMPIVLAAFMATLSAMLVVGGVSLALFSIDRLFEVAIRDKVYLDLFFVGFFLLAPLTAFAWLPSPFGNMQSQPRWLKKTARILLTPLCLLYALILILYIGKIALATRWPDGWVAMPTFIFGAVGLTTYLIARPARDRGQEAWAGRFCRIFPWVLLPLAVVLILAMRVRILDYGFTEWRVIGLALGVWFLLFAIAYAWRPAASPWWIAVSMGALALLLGIGPLSASQVSLHSQRQRLDRLLTEAGVRVGEPVSIEGDVAKRVRSGITYLLNHHGPQGLPGWVQERVATCSRTTDYDLHSKPRSRTRRLNTQQVLVALDLTLRNGTGSRLWHRILMEDDAIALASHHSLFFGRTGETNALPFRIDHELRVFVGDEEIATSERARFVSDLEEALNGRSTGMLTLPHERMSMVISHEGDVFTILFPTLNLRRHGEHHPENPIAFGHYGGYFLVLKQERP